MLQETEASESAKTQPKRVDLITFRNPEQPKAIRSFDQVTGQLVDESRNLIYIVNDEGLWILQNQTAQNQQEESDFEKRLRYDR